MKKRIFTIALSLVLIVAALPMTAAAAGRPVCRPHYWYCLIQCPSRPQQPETPDAPQQPEAPDTPQQPETPDTPQQPETPDTPTVPDTDTEITSVEQEAMRLVNTQRTNNGLQPLTVSEELTVKARIKSRDMKDNQYFSHNSPTYGSPFEMMKQLGITYRSAGENIAMGYRTAEAVVSAWMQSESHRANILSTRYTSMGIGYADGYWTQWFIG